MGFYYAQNRQLLLWTSFGILVTQQALTDSAVFKDTHVFNGSSLELKVPSSRDLELVTEFLPTSSTSQLLLMFLYTEILLEQ